MRTISKNPDMEKKQHGFTPIELMIEITIIGTVAAVAIPMYLDDTVRSQIAEGINVAGGAKSAVTEYYQDRSVFPTDNAEAGLEAAGNIQGKYVASVSANGAIITIQYGNDTNVQINGETATLTATDNLGVLSMTVRVSQICDIRGPSYRSF